MNYRIIPVTAFAQNCSLIWCEQTKLAALVDPGGDAETIKQQIERQPQGHESVKLFHPPSIAQECLMPGESAWPDQIAAKLFSFGSYS